MNSIHFIAASAVAVCIIFFALAMPLIARRVPPNAFYGVRTKAAFASEADWFRINTIGGRYLAWGGGLLLLTGAAGFFVPRSGAAFYSVAYIAVLIVATLAMCIRVSLYRPR